MTSPPMHTESLEQSRLEQTSLEQSRLEQSRLEQSQLEQSRLEQSRLEQDLIGLLLIGDGARYEAVCETLRPVHFIHDHCRMIYEALQKLHQTRNSFSLSLLASFCAGNDVMDHLVLMQAEAPLGVDETDLADTLIDLWYRRAFRENVKALSALAAKPDLMGEEIVEAGIGALTRGFDDQENGDVAPAYKLTGAIVSPPKEALESGFNTGLGFFDALLAPLLPGQVIVIGGATSSGKSSLAQVLAWTAAKCGAPSYFITNEMTAAETMQRIMAQVSRVPLSRITNPLSRESGDAAKLASAASRINDWPLMIDGREKADCRALRLRIGRAKRQMGVKLVFIDHLQFIKPDNPRDLEREKLGQVTSDVKAIAKSLGVTIVLVSHLNREAMQYELKKPTKIERPNMRHLYGSSSIEKDADGVIFVHRPSYFLERLKPSGNARDLLEWDEQMNQWRGKAEIIKHKQRQGKGFGLRVVSFHEETTLFSDFHTGSLE